MKTGKLHTDLHEIKEMLDDYGSSSVLIVCDKFLTESETVKYIKSICDRTAVFSEFQPNPLFENVREGVRIFRENRCDCLIAIGGGSAIDVAKCIKLFELMADELDFLEQKYVSTEVPLIAIPTTCGTGSEATRFAVIYYQGVKQSINSTMIIPNQILLLPELIKTLPDYQKKATMLDALSQAIESYWSVNSTDESKEYSRKAIPLILNNYQKYLENDETAIKNMQLAAYYAGEAINSSQTTAAHAMSYKITSLYHIPHGHAVAMCLMPIWEYMLTDKAEIIDPRGREYYLQTMQEIHDLLGGGLETYKAVYKSLNIDRKLDNPDDLDVLVKSVNTTRLKNHPVLLTDNIIRELYLNCY
ncbi:MAG: phosphonoacetaldehyde reductase [Erysipelotrichaceae bacterium]|nr:phosphonoacetaldehyde reductase [Erysipelotrichaceae bacterium]